MQHCLKLGLMIEVGVQGTSKITMIHRVGSRGDSLGDMQVDIFWYSKL